MNPCRRAAWQRCRRTPSAGRTKAAGSPAFVGSGAGLANVNAALLDGLDSAAFAAAAHGHDVSHVTNAARLAGGNTFTGTQTIVNGNLDLFHSIGRNRRSDEERRAVSAQPRRSGRFKYLPRALRGDQCHGDRRSERRHVGYLALFNNTDGFLNTATGANALFSNTTGSGNTADGRRALLFNETGSFNTAIGLFALGSNTTGDSNTALVLAHCSTTRPARATSRLESMPDWCLDGIEQHLSRRRGPGYCHRVQHHAPGQSGHAKQDVYRGSPWHHDRQPGCDYRDDRFSRTAGDGRVFPALQGGHPRHGRREPAAVPAAGR